MRRYAPNINNPVIYKRIKRASDVSLFFKSSTYFVLTGLVNIEIFKTSLLENVRDLKNHFDHAIKYVYFYRPSFKLGICYSFLLLLISHANRCINFLNKLHTGLLESMLYETQVDNNGFKNLNQKFRTFNV